jgi:hypothetical protein
MRWPQPHLLLLRAAVSQAAAIPILTYHYDKARTGANTQETILTPANVNTSHFGKLFSVPVDSGIYASRRPSFATISKIIRIPIPVSACDSLMLPRRFNVSLGFNDLTHGHPRYLS